MPYLPPPAKNYQSNLVAIPSIVRRDPREGDKMIPVEIDWANDGGDNNCVSINIQNNATLEFSQIVALSVDNSDCGADIRFVFSDTSETITIPAYAPKIIIEVFTSALQFIVQAGFNSETVLANDSSRFSILNFLPPPIAVPTTQEQAIAAVSANATQATTQVIPAGVNGTLEQAYVTFTTWSSVSADAGWDLKDGTGQLIGIGHVATEGSFKTQLVIFQLVNAAVRFSNGIVLEIQNNGLDASTQWNTNLYYRTP